MFGIGLGEFIVILLLMVIFIKPKDIPSVVNFIASLWHKTSLFLKRIRSQISTITSEIDNTQEIQELIDETFHERVERLRLKINEEPDFFEWNDDGNKRQPKLDIPKKKTQTKSKKSK